MTDNDNLELKKRSRRRLVGAAALALIAAIMLPMVMDDEPGMPIQDIQVTIPDRDADSRLARPIVGLGAVVPEPESVPAPFEQPPSAADAQSPSADDLTPAPPPAASAPPAAIVREETSPSPRSPPSAGAKPADSSRREAAAVAPSAAPPSAGDEAARVRAILEGRLSAATSAGQTFVVQVGAFSEAGKAASLNADLTSRGFNAFTEDAGAVTRVRIGPFATRAEAEKAVERLGVLGLDGVVAVR